MKNIERLTVEVTYIVTLLNVELPDEIYSELSENEEISSGDIPQLDAMDWLSSNISECDGLDWKYVISDFSE